MGKGGGPSPESSLWINVIPRRKTHNSTMEFHHFHESLDMRHFHCHRADTFQRAPLRTHSPRHYTWEPTWEHSSSPSHHDVDSPSRPPTWEPTWEDPWEKKLRSAEPILQDQTPANTFPEAVALEQPCEHPCEHIPRGTTPGNPPGNAPLHHSITMSTALQDHPPGKTPGKKVSDTQVPSQVQCLGDYLWERPVSRTEHPRSPPRSPPRCGASGITSRNTPGFSVRKKNLYKLF